MSSAPTRNRIWRILKWLSLSVAIGAILLTILFMQRGDERQPPSEQQPTAHDAPKTAVDSPLLVERKHGKIIWKLRAESAKQQLDGSMRLHLPQLTMFTDTGEAIIITSREARFEPLQRNIHFQHQVVTRFDDWSLTSESLIYVSASDTIHIPGAFQLHGNTMQAHGSDMQLDRNHEQLDVRNGIWLEDRGNHWQSRHP